MPQRQLAKIDNKMSYLVERMEELFTPYLPQELDIASKINKFGTVDECLKPENEKKLDKIVSQCKCADDNSGKIKGNTAGNQKQTALSVFELRHLRTPVEQLLMENLSRFEMKLDAATVRMEKTLVKHLKAMETARVYERIEDPVRKRVLHEKN